MGRVRTLQISCAESSTELYVVFRRKEERYLTSFSDKGRLYLPQSHVGTLGKGDVIDFKVSNEKEEGNHKAAVPLSMRGKKISGEKDVQEFGGAPSN